MNWLHIETPTWFFFYCFFSPKKENFPNPKISQFWSFSLSTTHLWGCFPLLSPLIEWLPHPSLLLSIHHHHFAIIRNNADNKFNFLFTFFLVYSIPNCNNIIENDVFPSFTSINHVSSRESIITAQNFDIYLFSKPFAIFSHPTNAFKFAPLAPNLPQLEI